LLGGEKMSNLDRAKIRRMILKEFKMLGMTGMGTAGMEPMGMSHSHDTHDTQPSMSSESMSGVSKEDCCAAVMCLIECCSCPATKQALMQCCQDILAGRM
jgi:hypothetical protein